MAKKTPKRKKPMSSILETYNQVNMEEKLVASFKLDLNSMLDGHIRELCKIFSVKLKVDFPLSTAQSAAPDKKGDDAKKKKETKPTAKPDGKGF